MSLVSVYIIAFNEAEKVRSTIESVHWADEIVLIDSWSTDGTADIAASLGARVVQVKFTGFGDLRNAAVDACIHNWIFSLDADERERHAGQILKRVSKNQKESLAQHAARNRMYERKRRAAKKAEQA
jgi:glycosyltransferase involved in cell wall biosynthesis